MSHKKSISQAKSILMHIIKNVQFDVPYECEILTENVDRYSSQMRVELSRLRTRVKNQGKKPRAFKLLKLKQVDFPETGMSKVTFQKTTPDGEKILSGVNIEANELAESGLV